MKKNKVMPVLLATAMTVGMFAGCGGNGGDTPAGNNTQGGQETKSDISIRALKI